MAAKKIQVAARELKRLVNSAVGRSFCKTLTEPLTNSDSALKDKAGVPHASGVVEAMMQLRAGDKVDTAHLKKTLPKQSSRKIVIEIFPAKVSGREARLCRVIDSGPGMSRDDLERNFGVYAEAKAKGRKTRSLFGRGALDVLLYHDGSVIYSIKEGKLARCRIYWDSATKEPTCDAEELGEATKALIGKHRLERIGVSGTIVEFRLKEGTHIPQTEEVIGRLSSFYMLRLIAADPHTSVVVEQSRVGGRREERLSYDFPVGVVLGRFADTLTLGPDGNYKVDILVARADAQLQGDPINIERRQCGLLFVDDNDAVLDLTLLPEHERNPYLQSIFGIVRITGLRSLLESKLEADDAAAVLTETRDGFNRKHEITQNLFALVEKHVKPLYEAEEKRQKKGEGSRSDRLAQRVKEVLKILNQFNAEETDDTDIGPPPPPPEPPAPIFFGAKTMRLLVGVPKKTYVFVDLTQVKNGEIVLFESDNPDIKVEPDSEVVKHGKDRCQRFEITITGSIKGQTAHIQALTVSKNGQNLAASMEILGVDDPPVPHIPDDIEFVSSTFSGDPNRANKAALLINLDAFPGLPEVTFWVEDVEGKVTLGDAGQERLQVKTAEVHKISGHNAARVPVVFRGTGWAQKATLCAKCKRSDGTVAIARCRVRFQRPPGTDKFSDFFYEDLKRNVIGDVAQDKLYINAGYALHRRIFGETQAQFDQQLESDPIAQMRAAFVLVTVTVYQVATTKYWKGGKKGLNYDPSDPIGSVRAYVEEHQMKLEPRIMKALMPDLGKKNGSKEGVGVEVDDQSSAAEEPRGDLFAESEVFTMEPAGGGE